jgi:hypothetical protein
MIVGMTSSTFFWSLLVRNLSKVVTHLKKNPILFNTKLCILHLSLLSDCMCAYVCFLSMDCLFILLPVSFEEQSFQFDNIKSIFVVWELLCLFCSKKSTLIFYVLCFRLDIL